MKSQKQSLEWYQTEDTLTIRLQISGVSLKKIDFSLADLVLKINFLERNSIKFLDFLKKVDYLNKANSFLYINETLEITLQKDEKGLWPTLLIQKMEKEYVLKRRNDSFERKMASEKEFHANLNEIKIKYDRHSVNEQMRLETNERLLLEQRKKEEKDQAIKDLYQSIDHDHKLRKPIEKNSLNKKEEVLDEENSKTHKNEENQLIKTSSELLKDKDEDILKPQKDFTEEISESNELKQHHRELFDEKDFITEEKIEEFLEVREIPEPRSEKSVQLKFTEKVFPHLAARDHQVSEAPFPKNKQTGTKDQDPNNNQNPLWLKDKGDDFYRNKDYYSAINAYDTAFRKNEKLLECKANRSACHLALFNFRECIDDCNEVLNYIEKLPEGERETYNLMRTRLMSRKAVALSWEGSGLESAENIFQELRINPNLKEEISLQIVKAHELLQTRISSIPHKKLGDIEFKNGNYDKSILFYQSALEIDPTNEIVLGNLSLSYFRLQNYKKSLSTLEEVLALLFTRLPLSQINNNNKSSSQETKPYFIKLLFRKIDLLKKMDEKDKVSEIINEILRLDDKNKEAIGLLKEIEEDRLLKEVQKLKTEAANFIVKEDFLSALNLYNESLKKINQKSLEGVLEYLAILLNKAICHLKLEQWDDIINIGIRGLKLIRSMRSSLVENRRLSKEQKIKLTNFEIRFLMRRANAYLRQSQIFNAKSDMEAALELEPENKEILEELEKIRSISI